MSSNSQKHSAIALISKNRLGLVEVPTRSPEASEVLIKVDYAAYTAADGHAVDNNFHVDQYPHVIGLVAVGKVVEVGSTVDWLQKGDNVGAYTQPGADRATQQYVVAPANRVTKIPDGIKPEDVAAVIDNFVTAWWTITNSLELPLPDTFPSTQLLGHATQSSPILIWGGGTSSSVYILQVLRLAGYSNLITTASSYTGAAAFAFGATHVFDYDDPEVSLKIKSVAGTAPITHAVDPICTKSSLEQIAKVVTEPNSKVAVLPPFKVGELNRLNDGTAELVRALPDHLQESFEIGVEVVPTYTFTWESNPKLKENLLTRILPKLLESGQIKAQEIHLIKEGSLLERVQEAANLTKGNQLRGKRAIIDLNA